MMIIAACAFIFVALFSIAFGIHLISVADRRAMIRRRLEAAESMSDVLDTTILREQRMSSIGILSRLLGGLRPAQRLERLMAQAAVESNVSVFLLTSGAIAVMTGLLIKLLLGHTLLAIFIGISASLVPIMFLFIRKERRVRAFNEQFPEALDLMVNALRAGFAMNGAIQMVAEESPDPVGQEFRVVYEEQQLGLDIRQALMNLADRMDSTDSALFVTAVLIQRDTGGNLAEVLDKIAYVIRDRFRILGEVRTFTAQGRLSGLILACLPLIVAFVMSTLSPGYMETLLTTRAGNIMLNVAIALQIIGFLVIRRVINIRV